MLMGCSLRPEHPGSVDACGATRRHGSGEERDGKEPGCRHHVRHDIARGDAKQEPRRDGNGERESENDGSDTRSDSRSTPAGLRPHRSIPWVARRGTMLLMRRLLLLSALLIAVPGCGGAPASSSASQPSAPTAPMPLAAMPKIEGGAIMEHVKVLASDEYEGRAPGGKGDQLTVKYIESQFTQLGLKPGNPDGTFFQKVPLVGITAKESRPLTLTTGTGQQTFKWGDDVVAWSKHVAATASLQASDVVFAGYGVEAPEYRWNDFKDVDVKGKTIIVLVNDPAVPDPADPSKLDPKTFGGDAMTYYGRWTYKYEIASEKGAAAAILVHETGPAGYPYSVVVGSWGRENFDIVEPAGGDKARNNVRKARNLRRGKHDHIRVDDEVL